MPGSPIRFFLLNLINLVGGGGYADAMIHVQRSEGDFPESVLSFHRTGPGCGPQGLRLASKHLGWLSRLAGLLFSFSKPCVRAHTCQQLASDASVTLCLVF